MLRCVQICNMYSPPVKSIQPKQQHLLSTVVLVFKYSKNFRMMKPKIWAEETDLDNNFSKIPWGSPLGKTIYFMLQMPHLQRGHTKWRGECALPSGAASPIPPSKGNIPSKDYVPLFHPDGRSSTPVRLGFQWGWGRGGGGRRNS
jgi:hypothetical protein